ncbi:MAG TPA: hypothetical protein VFA33_29245 [Bryobacteraceae bacterium]|nr:hypothetical protein [Bryobacteraceae bacterium]
MAKFKPAGKKAKSSAAPAGGIPCLILLFLAMALVILFLVYFMKYASR